MHREKKNADRAAVAAAAGLLLLLALDGSVDHEVGEVDVTFSLLSLWTQKWVLKKQTATLQHFLMAAAAFNHTPLLRDFFFFAYRHGAEIAVRARLTLCLVVRAVQGTSVMRSCCRLSHPICK